MGRRKKSRLSRALRKHAEHIVPVEREQLTVTCPQCQMDVYTTDKAEVDKALRNDEAVGAEMFRPTKEVESTISDLGHDSVQLDCPWCGVDVIWRHMYGGWLLHTKEQGKYPNVHRASGLRLRHHHYHDPHDSFAEVREYIFHGGDGSASGA